MSTQTSERATDTLVVRSMNIDYSNALYLSNASIKQKLDSNNESRILVWFVIKKKMEGFWIEGEGRAKIHVTNQDCEFFKGSLDYCNMGNSFVGQTMQKLYMPIIERYGNISLRCPLNINSYFMDIPLRALQMPPLIPRFDNDWILKCSIKNKIPGKRMTRVFGFTVTGSITFK
jgi:hypothetical protein